MNKTLKYGLIFAGTCGAAYLIIKLVKGKGKDAANGAADIVPVTTGDGVTRTPRVSNLNRDKILKINLYDSAEVKALQRILGIDDDGDFGPNTLAALQKQAGVDETTLNKVELQIAAILAKLKASQTASTVRTKFPFGKAVVAAITFRASAYVYRNAAWYPTDSEGNPLPTKEFKATADVGTVHDYSKTNPDVVIIMLKNRLDNYSYIGVKSSWIK